MKQAFQIDITDQQGRPTGQHTTLDEANDRGLWHRTAHVFIFTPEGQVLVQKRSASIIRSPGLLDLSVGGVLHSGETPEQAITRRCFEELGLAIDTSQLEYIGTSHYNHAVPSYHKHVRVILVNFILMLPTINVPLRYLESEVAWAGFIGWQDTIRLIDKGRLPHIGSLMPRYAYYRQFLLVVASKLER